MTKRAFDFTAALIGLILISPFLILGALLVWLLDGRPIFFHQERIGRGGIPFRILKFRTMKVNNSGPMITTANDSRITRSGRFLRKSKIDELPQLWNVLIGDMSLVGPRPDVAKHIALYSVLDREVLNYRPGITSPASLAYFNEGEILRLQADPETYYREVIMPHKNSINREYSARAGFFSDLGVILRTVLHGIGIRR